MTELTIELIPAGPDDIDMISNLYQFYAYESSDWESQDVEEDGRFYVHEGHLIRYWEEQDWSANLLWVNGQLAGFVLIERSEVPGIDALELADLFILKRYRRKGIGSAMMEQVLMGGHENWLVRYFPQDEVAHAFWTKVLEALPRPTRAIDLDDDPNLVNYLVTRVMH
ncbi:GNAT family N-acetyltransferase [Pseudomonas ovata]|uniref:GNAT family N-acetyltransferase n=1 Tax=Pseudomonas ovata TaxID=1839709 RepID=UPI000D692A29|nr:GNAT family N-acetyltransferase [Pseudomonas ovata]